MGCSTSRESINEEKLITFAEDGLLFTQLNAKDLDIVFRKYHCNGEISQTQLIQISKKLNFRFLNAGVHNHILSFYQSLKSESSSYKLKDLLLIAFLLGKGTPAQKAKLIYDLFDEMCTHQLDIELVKSEIIERMLNHSSQTLLILVSSSQLQPEEEMKLFKYRERLINSIPLAAEKIAEKLTIRGKVISQDTFIEVFSDPQLVNSSGIRNFMMNMHSPNKIIISS